MAEARCYSEELRAIGQMLEAKSITDFDLKHLMTSYVIQDLNEQTSLTPRLRNWFRRVHHGEIGGLRLGLDDVGKLSKAGRARRLKPGQLTQFRDLSNILRTIGVYLDSKQVELVELEKRPISITLEYRDKSGHSEREDRSISSFYKLFLELYDKRGKPQGLASR